MSPKKRPTRKRGTTATTRTARDSRRDPIVLDDPHRWPLALWAVLVLVWFLGSLLTFTLSLTEATYITSGAEVTTQSRRDVVGYLIGLMVFALGTPLAGVIAATALRRRTAAVTFAVLLLTSAGILFTVTPPGEIITAISGAYG